MRRAKALGKVSLIGVLIPLLNSWLFAQQQPDKNVRKVSATLSLDVDLVSLNVVVTDQKGQVVNDLSQEDFKVYEDRVEQPIGFFSHEETPVSWGLVLDRSRSMSSVIRGVHQAALHLTEEGTGQDEMFILTFNDEKQMVQDFTSDRDRLANALFGLESGGRTAMFDATAFALERLREGVHSKKALIVVSDGEDNSSELTLKELIEIAEEQDGLIYVIGLFEPPDPGRKGQRDWGPRGQLEQLAKVTGGRAFFPGDVHQCQEAVRKIAMEVSHQYNLGYYPSKPVHDGEWRKIKVELVHQREPGRRYVARTRTRYFAARR